MSKTVEVRIMKSETSKNETSVIHVNSLTESAINSD